MGKNAPIWLEFCDPLSQARAPSKLIPTEVFAIGKIIQQYTNETPL